VGDGRFKLVFFRGKKKKKTPRRGGDPFGAYGSGKVSFFGAGRLKHIGGKKKNWADLWLRLKKKKGLSRGGKRHWKKNVFCGVMGETPRHKKSFTWLL